jgi:hypothetical protein
MHLDKISFPSFQGGMIFSLIFFFSQVDRASINNKPLVCLLLLLFLFSKESQ